ncbi:MAG: DEAD/DEAH box helicase [Candidatus Absconditabacterales bacterium]|nr:DEAD/DEAH box helicase [Candidatus Absconditabacterales bacterium]
MLIEKTGYGKSLCYQFPATQFSGTTIVFSPLIALMRDQVIKLQEKGIAAEYINYQQTQEEQEEIFEKLVTGKVKILYISPERIDNDMWRENFKKINISFIVVDEAHCISVRGHDFRPHYRRIVEIVKLLPDNTPVLAVTATATKDVEEDIKKQLGEDKVTSVRGSLMRKNLKLSVQRCNSFEEKFLWLGNNVNNFKGNGIIYTGTVKDTMIYSKWLNYIGIPSVYYNGRMKGEEKQIIEKGLMNNEWK